MCKSRLQPFFLEKEKRIIVIYRFWKNSSFTFEARVSSKWLASITVLQKIVSLPVPSLSYGSTGLYSAEPPSADTVLDNILPNAFNRSFSSKGLQHTSPLVRYATMVVLSASFQKYSKVVLSFERVIKDLESLENKDSSRLKNSENWFQCLQNVREGIRRRTPEIQTIVNLFKQTTNQKETGDVDEEELNMQRQLLQQTSFKLIRYYQELVPETLMETNIDPSHFIPADILSVKPGSLIQLLHLFLNMPNFNWTSRSSGSSSTHITVLLTLYLQTPYRYIRNLTGRLLNQTLSDSFMFSHDPEEVQLWLNALPQNYNNDTSMSETQQAILSYLDNCIHRFNRAQYKYTDQLVSLVDKVNKNHTLNNHSEYKHPFSPLLLTLRENLDFIKGDKQPALLYFTSLAPVLLSKQNVPYYIQDLYSTLQQEAVEEEKEPSKITQWTQANMVRNARICLGIEKIAKKPFSNTDVREAFSDILSKSYNKPAVAFTNPPFKIAKDVQDVSSARKEFVELLEQLPVYELNSCLEDAARFCHDSLDWVSFEPLVEYIRIRHPLVGSIFSYTSVQNMKSLDSTEL